MVNVTKENFLEQSNDLIEHLPKASFVAIDEEMTGISLPNSRPNKGDTPGERYGVLKKVPETYSIIQFGIALFMPRPNRKNPGDFDVRKYNFYLFPTAGPAARQVTLNASSIHFLSSHDMSFDTWIKEGIPYCTSNQASELIARYRKKARSLQSETSNGGSSNTPNTQQRQVELTRPEDVNFHARAMAGLREWIDSASREAEAANNNNEGTSYLLPHANAFLRRALYESIQAEYPSLVLERMQQSSQIKVLRMTQEERLVRNQRQRREAFSQLITQELGFWRIFYALSQANQGYKVNNSIALAKSLDDIQLDQTLELEPTRPVPMVVHNGLHDLLFLLTHCHAPQLPEAYSDAKILIRKFFPNLYDTKVMSTEGPTRYENTVLSSLFQSVVTEAVSNKLFLVNSEPDDPEEGMAHEASYDAYMTGSIFFGLVEGYVNPTVGETILPWTAGRHHAEWRDRFQKNKLYLMLTMYTLDLEVSDTEDPLSRGMHVDSTFRVADNDPSISTRDIVRCLASLRSPFSDTRLHFEIIWIDDTTFMVAARDAGSMDRQLEHGKLIRQALETRFSTSTICTLQEYLQQAVDEKRRRHLMAVGTASPRGKRQAWKVWKWLGLKGDDDDDEDESKEEGGPSRKRPRVETNTN